MKILNKIQPSPLNFTPLIPDNGSEGKEFLVDTIMDAGIQKGSKDKYIAVARVSRLLPMGLITFTIAFTGCISLEEFKRGWIFSNFSKSSSHDSSDHSSQSYSGSASRRSIVRTAQRYLGTRYKHGGTTPRGFDCSGYVMYVYRKNGISVPRTTDKQYQSGKRISLKGAQPGDLVFFHTSRKRISHVGIYLGNYKFIHAPRTGKRISYASIKNQYWRKRYIGTVTYISGRSNYRGFGFRRRF